MKRLAMILLVLFVATSLFAGGKNCDLNKRAKSVELTGTLAKSGSGDDEKTIFRLADGKSYSVCHETKASVLKLGSDGATLRVKGKVVNCGDGEELMISEAKKI
ncbi:MAG TPA: hypothetical protein VNA69_12695 [Thermoanaerobaculia bacterium]|nr:hypothetical protein [Thermoanaerobaculia bacterium]